ncbi:hypothetical protein Bbelb_083890, partial [Branchiostoma belcheri]
DRNGGVTVDVARTTQHQERTQASAARIQAVPVVPGMVGVEVPQENHYGGRMGDVVKATQHRERRRASVTRTDPPPVVILPLVGVGVLIITANVSAVGTIVKGGSTY